MTKPDCGGSTPTDTRLGVYLTIILGTVGVVAGASAAFEWIAKPAEHLITILGGSFPATAVSGAVVGAALAAGLVWSTALDRLNGRDGRDVWYAGVVNDVVGAFSEWGNYFFPWTAQHTRVDVVVKPAYWDKVIAPPSPPYVWCNDDTLKSPVIRSYFKTPVIIGAAVGSMIGAAAGAVAGVVLGIVVGSLLPCAAPVIGWILCILGLLVAAVVAAVVALAGATIGGDIGAAAVAPDSRPEYLGNISVGAYVSVHANLVVYAEDKNANVAWWVSEVRSAGTSVSGEGGGSNPPFNYADPRDHYTPDNCPPPMTDTGP